MVIIYFCPKMAWFLSLIHLLFSIALFIIHCKLMLVPQCSLCLRSFLNYSRKEKLLNVKIFSFNRISGNIYYGSFLCSFYSRGEWLFIQPLLFQGTIKRKAHSKFSDYFMGNRYTFRGINCAILTLLPLYNCEL